MFRIKFRAFFLFSTYIKIPRFEEFILQENCKIAPQITLFSAGRKYNSWSKYCIYGTQNAR